jgi:regulator of sigma E protease
MEAGSVALAILSLGFLIVVHEAGHYIVARWCKMRVERFSVGFGPGILKRKAKSGTIFQLAPIPFGGFVEIRGMNIAEEIDPEDVHAYPNRPAWQRFLTILAGPATNYLSAIFLMFALYTCGGMAGDTFYVGDVMTGYDASGKLLPGDRIVKIDGAPMFSPGSDDLAAVISKNEGKPLEVTVMRHDFQQITVSIMPKPQTDDAGKVLLFDKTGRAVESGGKPHYLLGIRPRADIVDVGIGYAAKNAITYPVDQTRLILKGLHDIFTGKEEMDAGGPVRIVSEFKNAFGRGMRDGIMLLAALSVYLGLFNLFPLPALDGGRLVFLLYEMVTRRRANPKIETMVHMGGIMVLLVVMILVTLRDIKVF